MARKSRYEARIEDYIEAVIEHESYLPIEGEEQTEARESKRKLAASRMKLCYATLRGQDIGEARRRLAALKAGAILDAQDVPTEGRLDGNELQATR
jgi:uncharacterized protein YjbI with pentapeptide repeats